MHVLCFGYETLCVVDSTIVALFSGSLKQGFPFLNHLGKTTVSGQHGVAGWNDT